MAANWFSLKSLNNWILIDPNTKGVLTVELAGIFPHAIQPHWEYCDPGVLKEHWIWLFPNSEKNSEMCQFYINRTSSNLCEFPHSECEIQSCLLRISVDFFFKNKTLLKYCDCPNVKSPHRMEIIFDKNVSKNVITLFFTNMMHVQLNSGSSPCPAHTALIYQIQRSGTLMKCISDVCILWSNSWKYCSDLCPSRILLFLFCV